MKRTFAAAAAVVLTATGVSLGLMARPMPMAAQIAHSDLVVTATVTEVGEPETLKRRMPGQTKAADGTFRVYKLTVTKVWRDPHKALVAKSCGKDCKGPPCEHWEKAVPAPKIITVLGRAMKVAPAGGGRPGRMVLPPRLPGRMNSPTLAKGTSYALILTKLPGTDEYYLSP